jgi:ATP-dependent Clp protease ATP-binding subunit ClpA
MDGYNFTENVRRALAQARDEAVAFNHAYVGTEHLLLGMLAFDEGVGCTVLRNLGVDISRAVALILARLKRGEPTHGMGPDLAYTSRGKTVLALAMTEARELNHSYVGTEHLLLGLLREEKGLAADVLRSLGVTLESARAEVLLFLENEAARIKPPSSRVEMPPLPERAVPVSAAGYNFTERMRKVLAFSREEAVWLGHEYVGTEHLLLGLIRDGDGVAATVLQNLSVELDEIRSKIEEMVRRGRATQTSAPDLPFTSRAKKVLELAMSEARELNHSYVGTEHLLLGLLREGKGIAAQVLIDAGVSFPGARAETLRILGTELPRASTTPPQSASSPKGAVPIAVRLIVRYDNGAVVTKTFSTAAEAAGFLTSQ